MTTNRITIKITREAAEILNQIKEEGKAAIHYASEAIKEKRQREVKKKDKYPPPNMQHEKVMSPYSTSNRKRL